MSEAHRPGVPAAHAEAVPYQVHTVLADNGTQFAERPRNRNTIVSRPMRFDLIREESSIKPLADFMASCNFARWFKTFGGLAPYK